MCRTTALALLCSLAILPRTATAQAPLQTELHAAESALATALTTKDAAAFDRWLAPDFVLRGGPDVARDAWIKNALALCWGDRFDITDFAVRASTLDTAIVSLVLVTYQDPATCEAATIRSLLTDVWVRRDGAWRLALRHSGPAGEGVAQQFAKTPAPPPLWERSAEVSLVATGGNTDTQTMGLGASLTWRPNPWTTDARVAFVRSVADDVTTAESLLATVRQARKVTGALDAFGRVQYVVDRFAGIDYRTAFDGGFGWEALAGPVHAVRIDGGIGVIREARLTGEDLTFPTGNAGAKWTWQLSKGAALTDQALLTLDLSDAGNWRVDNGLAFTSAMTRVLSLKLSHELKRVNEPAPGYGKTDTIVSAALVAKF